MVSVISVACPVCGAPLSDKSDVCPYCGSMLVIHLDTMPLNRPNLEHSIIRDQIASLRTRTRLDPNDVDARFGLSLAYFNLGLIDDAAGTIEDAARLEPENAQLQAQAAVMMRERFIRGDASARRQLNARVDAALRLDPNNLDAITIRAELLANDGHLNEALQEIRRVEAFATSAEISGASHRVQAVVAANLLNQDAWTDARTILSSLPEERARPLVAEYLDRALTGGDRLHVDRRALSRARLASFWIPFLAIDLAILVGIVVGVTTSSDVGWVAFFIALLAALVASYWIIRRAINTLWSSENVISPATIEDPRTSFEEMLAVGDSIDDVRQGSKLAFDPDQSFTWLTLARAQLAAMRPVA